MMKFHYMLETISTEKIGPVPDVVKTRISYLISTYSPITTIQHVLDGNVADKKDPLRKAETIPRRLLAPTPLPEKVVEKIHRDF
jgi:hypothetical protein